MLSFHVKFVPTDGQTTVKQYAPDLSIRRHKNASCHRDYHQSSERNWPNQGSDKQPPILKFSLLRTELPRLNCTHDGPRAMR